MNIVLYTNSWNIFFPSQGRLGKGSIFVFAAGNGGRVHDNCAYNGYANSIFTITVAGVNRNGSIPGYAERCSAIMACAYSQEDMGGHDAIVCFVDRKPTFTELENLKTPYLRRAGVAQCWERSPPTNVKQKSGFIKRVDKGLMNDHRERFRKLMFGSSALRQREWWRANARNVSFLNLSRWSFNLYQLAW